MRKTKDTFSEYEVVIDLLQSSKTVIRLKASLLSLQQTHLENRTEILLTWIIFFFSIACFGLYFLSSQNSNVEILARQGDGINGWSLGEVLKS